MNICAWCGRPATTTVEVRPAKTKVVAGERKIVERQHTWPACPAHATVQRTPPPSRRDGASPAPTR